jgi:hypothetical protein
MRWAGHVACIGEGETCTGFSKKTPKIKPLGRKRRRWKEGSKIDLRDIGWGVCSGFTSLRIGVASGRL